MNFELYERLYKGLNEFINQELNYAVSVQKKPYGEVYPKVVFKEISAPSITNRHKMESYTYYGYEIDIYAKQMGNKDGMAIAREICKVVSELFDDKLHFKRIYCSPTPNVDITIDRITMRYQSIANDFRGRFFI